MALAKSHVDNVCKLGKGARTCSFLVVGAGGFECAKGISMESTIRSHRYAGTMNAIGDNCSGPPDFTPSKIDIQLH